MAAEDIEIILGIARAGLFPAAVVTCALRREFFPTFTALVWDELIIFPWDKQVFVGGRWQPHPELVAALAAQQLD